MEAPPPPSLYDARPFRGAAAGPVDGLVSYFCAEYAITQALPIYAGGLGVLAGEHLKSASDVGVPMVAVGLAYRQGYFRQSLDAEGRQQATAEELDLSALLRLAEGPGGVPLRVEVHIGGRPVSVQVWEGAVGRTRLLLLDTFVDENAAADRTITGALYGGDSELRLRQEIVLGIGGVRALSALGVNPTVFHMNEGHSAFLVLERVRQAVQEMGLSFDAALERCRAQHVFTTHTPVPAGFDVFSREQMLRHFPDLGEALGVPDETWLALGRGGISDGFQMALVALRGSAHLNGVSQLHGQVSRAMWHGEWPQLAEDDVPIIGVTNGVHVPTWVGDPARAVLDEHLGPSWLDAGVDDPVWSRLGTLGDEALWAMRTASRARLVGALGGGLDPDVLTLGFARRFAPYKRATLIFRFADRIRRLMDHAERPMQIVFAGKAHPKDLAGQAILADVVRWSEDPSTAHRVFFVSGYDLHVAKALVEGVDLWLNTPRRPHEASGTSGMKVLVNGGLNVSVLDGWWDEAYDGQNGWAIGSRDPWSSPEEADAGEAEALLTLLEDEVTRAFYDRGADGIPRSWTARMRASMALTPRFSTGRMVREYAERLYRPAHEAGLASR